MNPCECGCGALCQLRFVRGHNSFGRPTRGKWGAHGVPIERVRPLVLWLCGRYHQRKAAEILGWHPGCVTKILYGPCKTISPERAKHIAETVLLHRMAQDPWAEAEPKRLASGNESDGRRRHLAAREQARYRARRARVLA